MTHYLSICEGAWGFGAGIAVLGELPQFDPAYNSTYSIVVIVATGMGIILARGITAVLQYRRGATLVDDEKLVFLAEQVRLLNERVKAGEKGDAVTHAA